jgi:hypothetical protein
LDDAFVKRFITLFVQHCDALLLHIDLVFIGEIGQLCPERFDGSGASLGKSEG